jgi:hypothetical protein
MYAPTTSVLQENLRCAVGTTHFLMPLAVNFNGKPPPPGFFAVKHSFKVVEPLADCN